MLGCPAMGWEPRSAGGREGDVVSQAMQTAGLRVCDVPSWLGLRCRIFCPVQPHLSPTAVPLRVPGPSFLLSSSKAAAVLHSHLLLRTHPVMSWCPPGPCPSCPFPIPNSLPFPRCLLFVPPCCCSPRFPLQVPGAGRVRVRMRVQMLQMVLGWCRPWAVVGSTLLSFAAPELSARVEFLKHSLRSL